MAGIKKADEAIAGCAKELEDEEARMDLKCLLQLRRAKLLKIVVSVQYASLTKRRLLLLLPNNHLHHLLPEPPHLIKEKSIFNFCPHIHLTRYSSVVSECTAVRITHFPHWMNVVTLGQ